MAMDIDHIRRDYLAKGLEREDLADSPFVQFEHWLRHAVDAGLADPTAMSLGTIDSSGRPWQRMVLLKHFDADGAVFFTNLGSRKAQAIAANPRVCLLFPWNTMERQVIIGGVAERVSARQTLAYFLSRPHESQLAAWASAQSRPISSRTLLEDEFARLKAKFAAGQVPVPDFWGGYRVRPDVFEFWQGRPSRMHDRFEYRLEGHSWHIERLAP